MRLRGWFLTLCSLLGIALCLHALYMPAKAILAQQLLLNAWETTKTDGRAVKPWPWADTEPLARLKFLTQEQDFIILAGSMGRTLTFAPGHVTGSALPHQAGHIVISAHRDSHFSILAEVALGDVVLLESYNGHIRHYQVTGREVIDSRNTSLIIDNTADKLTLITCYPFDAAVSGGPLRLQIEAVPIAASS